MSNTMLETLRKPQIIDAALQAIAEYGLANVTLDDVAKIANLSKGGVAHYFSSKDSLVRQAVVEFFDRIFERGREIRDLCDDPLSKVLSFAWLYDWEDSELDFGYKTLFDIMSLASRNEDYRMLFHEWVENWISLLAEAIQQGVESGQFRNLEVNHAARTVSAIYQGIADRWYLDRETHSTEWAISSMRIAVTLFLTEKC